MILEMSKYSFVLLDKDLNSFLEQLQQWGVMDITRTYKALDESGRQQIEEVRRYASALRELKNAKPKSENVTAKAVVDTTDILATAEKCLAQQRELSAQKLELQKELSAATAWGEFRTEDLARLRSLGLVPHFYVTAAKNFDAHWTENYALQILNRTHDKIHFVVVTPENEPFSFPIAETKFPERSCHDILNAIKENEDKQQANDAMLLALKKQTGLLQELKAKQEAQLDLYIANAAAEKGAEGHLAVIQGFAPTDLDHDIEEKLSNCDVYYLKDKAQPEDNPPIKLKNNKFAALFEPIGNLYMLPKYGELDLTPWFAPFYMLFFGLCLGDMGYGLLLFIAGIVGTFALPKMKSYAKLVALLGLGSIIMPAMTGTFFGVALYDHIAMPQWFYDVWYNPDTINIKMFWFALIFGVFQITVGRLLSAYHAFKTKGWQYGLANVGWAVFVVWAALFFAEWQGGFNLLSPIASKLMLGFSGICILFFSKITRNIFFRIAGGVKAVYDVTGFLGDILSYVRLFGLGAAGGILGLVMNQIALSLSGVPYVGWLLFLIMLVIGHSLVIFLSCLGAFVHPIRLTFVEFYKNAEFQGGGKKYNPMKK